jgi:hypothetical protein
VETLALLQSFCNGLHAVAKHWWKPWQYSKAAFCYVLHAVSKHRRDLSIMAVMHSVMDYMQSPNIGGNLGIIAEMHSVMECMQLPNIGGNLRIIAEMHSVMNYMQSPNTALVKTLALLQRYILLWTA